MKKIMIVVFGFLATITLLSLMTSLIAEPQMPKAKRLGPKPLPPIVPIKEKPPKPDSAKPLPPKMSVAPTLDINTDIQVEPLELEPLMVTEFSPVISNKVGEIVDMKELNSGFGGYDRDAMPLIQTTPSYPSVALHKGIEGWVKLQFDVDATGYANNIKVISSSHKRIFDLEAKKALKKWKFQPGKQNGVDVGREQQTVTMEFNLED